MNKRLQRLALTTTAVFAVGMAAWAGPQVDFLYSDASAQVYEAQSAALYTPVERPPAAVHWKWNRVEAQQAVQELFPKERQVVGKVRVVGASATDADAVDVAEVNSLVPSQDPADRNHFER